VEGRSALDPGVRSLVRWSIDAELGGSMRMTTATISPFQRTAHDAPRLAGLLAFVTLFAAVTAGCSDTSGDAAGGAGGTGGTSTSSMQTSTSTQSNSTGSQTTGSQTTGSQSTTGSQATTGSSMDPLEAARVTCINKINALRATK